MCSFTYRKLSPALQKKAISELNEVPARVDEDLKIIKVWIMKQTYLNARLDDQWLLIFLRNCKFSLERTKEKIDKFYTVKTLVPEIYQNRNPFDPVIQDILSKSVTLVVPNTVCETEPVILIMKQTSFDLTKYIYTDLIKAFLMIADAMIPDEDVAVVNGVICFIDLQGTNMSHLTVPIDTYKKVIYSLSHVYPIRIKSIRCINAYPAVELLINMVKPLLHNKLQKRFSVYSKDKCNEAFWDVPKKLLPKEYGGYGKNIDEITAEIKQRVESKAQWFKEDAQYGTNEKLRPGKPKSVNDMFGIEGSFRKLTID